jgi:feruloyl esterase
MYQAPGVARHAVIWKLMEHKVNGGNTALILLATSVFSVAPVVGASCESLTSLSLPNMEVSLAQVVAAGGFSSGGAPGGFQDLPAFCRVAATLRPTSDSDIKIEVWMPVSGWNGKFQAAGNGGWSGNIVYPAMGQALQRGYATSSTDTGHSGASGSFALGHPEKLIDFAYRSEHEMTVKAKAIIAAFYGAGPRLAYWVGCSSGGKQALKEAQMFPDDYDGIVAGAPANNWTHLMAAGLWVAQATLKDPASYIPPSKYPVIHKAALDACDALDGVKDGVIGNPAGCRFDPKVLECKSGDGPACLTAPQVEAARKIYSGVRNPRTGQEIYPGLEPGSELAWAAMAGGPKPFAIVDEHFKFVVFKDPNWDFRTLNFDSDVALADKLDNGVINATNPDLKKFTSHGGKLIQYHGWNDQLIAPRNSVNYYTSVSKAMGGAAKTAGAYRLFMAPGMNHCRGGDGPNSFDMVGAIEQWVERGQAPDQIIASHNTDGKVDRTRPLCPYPQVAKYKGTGSIDDAANFTCAAP